MTQPLYYTNCELRTIDLTAGDEDYVFVDYEDALHTNIQTAPVSISLGTYDDPGAWHPADLVQQNGELWQVRAGLFIGAALIYPLGDYWAWIQVTAAPATVTKRADNRLVRII